MDHDIEQAADKAAGDQVPAEAERPPGYCIQCGCPQWAPHSTDHDPQWVTGFFGEQSAKAAGDPVPAETTGDEPYLCPSCGERHGCLAAAAPLIVADRDAAIERLMATADDTAALVREQATVIEQATAEVADKDGTIHRQAINARNYVKERDQARVEVARLTAELETSRKVRMSHFKQLSKDQAKLAAVAEEIATSIEEAATHCSDGDRTGRARLAQAARIARNHGETLGGPR